LRIDSLSSVFFFILLLFAYEDEWVSVSVAFNKPLPPIRPTVQIGTY